MKSKQRAGMLRFGDPIFKSLVRDAGTQSPIYQESSAYGRSLRSVRFSHFADNRIPDRLSFCAGILRSAGLYDDESSFLKLESYHLKRLLHQHYDLHASTENKQQLLLPGVLHSVIHWAAYIELLKIAIQPCCEAVKINQVDSNDRS